MKKYIIIFFIGLVGINSLLYGPETKVVTDQQIAEQYTKAEKLLDDLIIRYQNDEYASQNQSVMKEKIRVQLGSTLFSDDALNQIVQTAFDEVYIGNISSKELASQLYDGLGKLKDGEQRLAENKTDLEKFANRFLYHNDKYHIYYITSLLQPLTWLCGHAVLYNAKYSDQHKEKILCPNAKTWEQKKIAEFKVYNEDEFKNFETKETGKVYGDNTTTEDGFIRLNNNTITQSYLTDEDLDRKILIV